jgi:Tfp pilus assembly protein PilN
VIDEISQIQEKIDELERRRNQLGGPVSVLEALREISIRSPENPRMFVDELSFDGPTILLRAKTSSFEAVETVKKNLAASELFRDVQVRDPRTTADGTVEFRLTITLGAGDPG